VIARPTGRNGLIISIETLKIISYWELETQIYSVGC